MAHLHFFIGKGGVGKTTCAAAFALGRADRGERVLVVSLDPAHNLGDVLDQEVGDRPVAITPTLWAWEVDTDRLLERYLERTLQALQRSYNYLTSLDLDKTLDLLRLSPGLEEHAILEGIRSALKGADRWDRIVFDTPPTALTLRVLALPRLGLLWVRRLSEMRAKILGYREAVERIKGEPSGLPVRPEKDPVMRELSSEEEALERLARTFSEPRRTTLTLVLTPETLPLREGLRAMKQLRGLGIPVQEVVVNRVDASKEARELLEEIRRAFTGVPVREIPQMKGEVRGLPILRELNAFLEGRPG